MPILETIRDVFGTDSTRQKNRTKIKAELATLEASATLARAITAQLSQLAERKAAAQQTCAEAVAKAESQLDSILDGTAAAITAGEEVSDKLIKQRDKLLDEIASAKSRLDAESEAIAKLSKHHQTRLAPLHAATNRISEVRGQLQAYGTADPDLLIDRFVNRERMVWAQKRLRSAERELQSATERLSFMARNREAAQQSDPPGEFRDGPEPTPVEIDATRDLHFWQAETCAAQQELDAASKQKEQIREEIISE